MYRRAREIAARRLQRSTAVRKAVGVVGPRRLRPAAMLGFRAGRYFGDRGGRSLPIVVVVSTGLQDADAERLARTVEYAQVVTGSFRPLFVIDRGEFGPFRARGYIVERVMRPDELAAVNPADSYPEYLFDRVTAIAREYGAKSVVPLPAGALAETDAVLLRLIGAPGAALRK